MARNRFEAPRGEELEGRLASVLEMDYLVFNTRSNDDAIHDHREGQRRIRSQRDAFQRAAGRDGNLHEELAKASVLLDGSGLRASSMGWKVQYRSGKRIVIDGPFTEAKEMIAGYILIQVKSPEEAREWSLRFPTSRGDNKDCEIEVQRLFTLEDFEPSAAIEHSKAMDAAGNEN